MSAGHSPLAQFEIKPLIQLPQVAGYDISFTNSSLFMVAAVAAVAMFFSYGMRKRALVPSRWQSLAEMMYEFVAKMLHDNVGHEGRKYFGFIFTTFVFVLTCNLLGMIPYSFTVTSHIAVTFAMAAFIFVGVTLVAIVKHGAKFFGFFLPAGVPLVMAPLMYVIELFAYLARPVSLSVRLAANMMAGHTMLKVIAGFVITLGAAEAVALNVTSLAPMIFLTALTGFEVFVALLQAYIFTVLTCIYLNDALHLH